MANLKPNKKRKKTPTTLKINNKKKCHPTPLPLVLGSILIVKTSQMEGKVGHVWQVIKAICMEDGRETREGEAES